MEDRENKVFTQKKMEHFGQIHTIPEEYFSLAFDLMGNNSNTSQRC